jgi:hypothetical protein
MRKRKRNKSTWPEPNAGLEAALGRFIIAWSILEQQLDFSIFEITNLDHDLSTSITANLGTKAKLDIFHSLTHCFRDVMGPTLLESVDRLVADTGSASGNLRNFIVHGQPFQMELPDGNIEIWAKLSARKGGVRGPMVRLSAEYVEEQTTTVRNLIDRWSHTRGALCKKLEIWDAINESELD